jgi:hypothetical protein
MIIEPFLTSLAVEVDAAAAAILALCARYLGGSRRDPLQTWHRPMYAFGSEVVQNVFGCRTSSVCA